MMTEAQTLWSVRLLGCADDVGTDVAAVMLGVARTTLSAWRTRSAAHHPGWHKHGDKVFYHRADLDRWLDRENNPSPGDMLVARCGRTLLHRAGGRSVGMPRCFLFSERGFCYPTSKQYRELDRCGNCFERRP